MKSTLNIFKPTRRICSGKRTRFPITLLRPENWLNSSNNDYSFSSLDGYVINRAGVASALMSRYEYEHEFVDRNQFIETLKNNFEKEIRCNLILANQLNIPYRVFLWPKDFPQEENIHKRKIIVFFPSLKNGQVDLSVAKWINLKGLEAGIKKYRGRSFSAVKSLTSASSVLECYLANYTQNPWPGDVDGLMLDKKSGLVKSIIEFKTHNIDSPIEKEYIGKYGKQDWRRFEVLYKLQDALEANQGMRPKLFFVVWGTGDFDNHENIKIDQIEQGESINSRLLKRPDFGAFSPNLFDILS